MHTPNPKRKFFGFRERVVVTFPDALEETIFSICR